MVQNPEEENHVKAAERLEVDAHEVPEDWFDLAPEEFSCSVEWAAARKLIGSPVAALVGRGNGLPFAPGFPPITHVTHHVR